jgi:hypothetical protein
VLGEAQYSALGKGDRPAATSLDTKAIATAFVRRGQGVMRPDFRPSGWASSAHDARGGISLLCLLP